MKYDFRKIEKKWQKKWLEEKIYEPRFNSKKSFYNLMMFPYLSAEGLHVGNMYAFTGADIYGRTKRMQGHDVFEPIGLDGFGIHSENYALKIKKNPADQAKISEKNFYRQLHEIGNGFTWSTKLETYDPEYYKWTQWIFVQMWKAGLAYRKKQEVNWCPGCKTVLADEQVVGPPSERVCERCATKVFKKYLEQWFFRITKYAEELLGGLNTLDWSERVKIAQKNWIGKSEGAFITFGIKGEERGVRGQVEVFTTRPDTLFGVTFIAISPDVAESWFKAGWKASAQVKRYVKKELARIYGGDVREKTGVPTGLTAINPATKRGVPVWVVNYVLRDVGTGAIMGVPAHDLRDHEFAKRYGLFSRKVVLPKELVSITRTARDIATGARPLLRVTTECWEGEGELVHSGDFDGMSSERARWAIAKKVRGRRTIAFRLRDWLISRQRYWGPPIPIIYCNECWERIAHSKEHIAALQEGVHYTTFDGKTYIIHPVPEENLPVKLPYVKNFQPKGTGKSPLATVPTFYKAKCPECGGDARRETDVSDTFLDSAWYYIAYLAKFRNSKFEIRNSDFKRRARRWLPVHLYTGGAEHSVLHLLYVRFVAKALADMGYVHFREPATRFRAHGLLIHEGAKMSKSKGNVVNPDEFIKKFGADALRMHLMFIGPFEEGGDFRDQGILGPVRFLQRVWKLSSGARGAGDAALDRILHQTIKKVTQDIEALKYNTAISALMMLLNEFEKAPLILNSSARGGPALYGQYSILLKLLAPFAPHMTEELWRGVLGHTTSIHHEAWPVYDQKMIQGEEITLVVQVDGKVRAVLRVPRGVTREEAGKKSFEEASVKRAILGRVKNIIYVADKLINIVTK